MIPHTIDKFDIIIDSDKPLCEFSHCFLIPVILLKESWPKKTFALDPQKLQDFVVGLGNTGLSVAHIYKNLGLTLPSPIAVINHR